MSYFELLLNWSYCYYIIVMLLSNYCLYRALPGPSSIPIANLAAVDFDKDVDAHMRVVASAGNLRARNYKIPEADLHKARGVAGKIIPAIATTTAFVSGRINEIYDKFD